MLKRGLTVCFILLFLLSQIFILSNLEDLLQLFKPQLVKASGELPGFGVLATRVGESGPAQICEVSLGEKNLSGIECMQVSVALNRYKSFFSYVLLAVLVDFFTCHILSCMQQIKILKENQNLIKILIDSLCPSSSFSP